MTAIKPFSLLTSFFLCLTFSPVYSQTDVPAVLVVGAGQTYTSLTGATGVFKFLNDNNWVQDITVNITSDLSESGDFPLNAANANGFKLTIQSSAPVLRVIQNASNLVEPLIRIFKTSNVLIDGSNGGNARNLRFINTNTNPQNCLAVILLDSNATKITLQHLIIESNIGEYYSEKANIVLGASGSNHTVSILNNKICDATGSPGTAGLTYAGIMSNNDLNHKLLIKGNEVSNFSRYGVNLNSAADSCVVDSNHFYYNAAAIAGITQTPINVEKGEGHIVSGNYIGGTTTFCGGSRWINDGNNTINYDNQLQFFGISYNFFGSPEADAITITGNRIANISLTKADDGSFTGILTQGPGIITDNIIGDPSGAVSIENYSSGFDARSTAISTGGNISNNHTVSGNTAAGFVVYGTTTSVSVSGLSIGGNGNAVVLNNSVHDFISYSSKTTLFAGGVITGIDLWSGMNGNLARGNIVYNLKALNPATNTRIMGISTSVSTIVNTNRLTGNRVYNLENASVSGFINGIDLTGYFTIDNNQVTLTNGSNTNPVTIRGIYDTSDSSYLYYNSIYIGGTATGTPGSYAYFTSPSTAVRKFQNNLLYNERSGGTGTHVAAGVALNLAAQRWTGQTSDYNLFITRDTAASLQWGFSTAPVPLRQWRGQTLGDSSSLAVTNLKIPATDLFPGLPVGDLNINTANEICWYLNGKGMPVDTLNADYLNPNGIRSGYIGNGATDIGSVEFDAVALPPVLRVTGNHVPGGADSLFFEDRLLAVLTWANTGTLPVLGNPRFYSGQWPNDGTNNNAVFTAETLNAWWDIPATGGNNYSYSLTLFYDSAILGQIRYPEEMVINKRQTGVPGSWQVILPTEVDEAKKTITISGQTSFSEFTATDPDANLQFPLVSLPVNLVSLSVTPDGSNVILDWKTSFETDNSYFEIERSINGVQFSGIGKVNGTNSNSTADYKWIDKDILDNGATVIYYRLKIVSITGKVDYSNIVNVTTAAKEFTISLFPNPAADFFTLKVRIPQSDNAVLKIIDISGRTLITESVKFTKGMNTYTVHGLRSLAKGIYIVHLQSKYGSANYKLIK